VKLDGETGKWKFEKRKWKTENGNAAESHVIPAKAGIQS